MPTNIVKTPADEKKWEKAKEQAKKEGHGKDYAYITTIYEAEKGKSKKSKK